MTERIGFIGVGHMGTPLVNCMLRGGYEVVVHDVRAEATAPFAARGVSVAASLADLADRSDIVDFCLLNDEDVSRLLFGETGLLGMMRKGQILMTHSTLSTEISEMIGAAARERGIGYLDAPVSGGQKERDDGTMTVFVGGADADYERALPVLRTIGATVVHMGPNGAGAIGKIANNLMQLSNTITAMEAMRLAAAYGVTEEKMVQLSSISSGNSWSLTNLAFFDDFLLNHQLASRPEELLAYLAKDIGLAAQAAEYKGLQLAIARSNEKLAPEIFGRRKAGLEESQT